MENNFITPNWPAPKHIKAYTTLRSLGNLASHTGDNLKMVQAHRELLKKQLHLPHDPVWLTQTHSTIAIEATEKNKNKEADASFTSQPNQVCVILTADCLPILLCNDSGTHIAAIHAGWRGLADGIIEATLEALNYQQHKNWLAWLGPAISKAHFDIGNDVRNQFFAQDKEAQHAFTPLPNQHWSADLYELARIRLQKKGISAIYGGEYCTYADANRFYSYRREGERAGRMATLIWIT